MLTISAWIVTVALSCEKMSIILLDDEWHTPRSMSCAGCFIVTPIS